jgi:hypothetical protein
MSVDDRLRDSLSKQADTHVPAVEDALDRLHARARRERWRTAGLAVATGAAAVVAAVVVGTTIGSGPSPSPDPVVPPPSPEETLAPLRGRIVGDVVRPASLSGTWTLDLAGNGTLEVTAPPRLGRSEEVAAFTVDGSSFRTTLFGAGPCRDSGTGIYEWARVGDVVTFTTLSDDCVTREQLLVRTRWSLSTEPPARG